MNAPCDWCEQDDVPTHPYVGTNDQDFYLCPQCLEFLESDSPLP